uniref:Chitinase n=1 Tax=Ganoderma boninense TaxID=34458 RepID=A0A5K1K4L2_9APHY|nr:Chitinase [Ganoderma boninense]
MITILVSRFLLDLQSADRLTRGAQGTTSTLNDGGMGSLVFDRVIGSLGSSFDTLRGPEDEDREDTLHGDEGGGGVRDAFTIELPRSREDLSADASEHCPSFDSELLRGRARDADKAAVVTTGTP